MVGYRVNVCLVCLFIRVNIPVIIMGETGCGKTKLIEFMSKLIVPTALKKKIKTMITVKVKYCFILKMCSQILFTGQKIAR